MKKLRDVKKLMVNRETLAHLDRLGSAQLDRVAGGTSNPCTGGSSCLHPHCTCPV
jgi:hypothetical protein